MGARAGALVSAPSAVTARLPVVGGEEEDREESATSSYPMGPTRQAPGSGGGYGLKRVACPSTGRPGRNVFTRPFLGRARGCPVPEFRPKATQISFENFGKLYPNFSKFSHKIYRGRYIKFEIEVRNFSAPRVRVGFDARASTQWVSRRSPRSARGTNPPARGLTGRARTGSAAGST